MIIIVANIGWTDSHSSAGPVCTSEEATGCAAKHKHLGPATKSIFCNNIYFLQQYLCQYLQQNLWNVSANNGKGHFYIYPDSNNEVLQKSKKRKTYFGDPDAALLSTLLMSP